MAEPRIDWRSLSYRPGDTLRAVIVVPGADHRPPRSLTWTVFYNATPISSGAGTAVIVHDAGHGVYKVEAVLVDFMGVTLVLRSAVSVSGGTEARAVLPPPPFKGSMVQLGVVYGVEVVGLAGESPVAPAQLAGLTQAVYLLPGTTHISFALDPEQAETDGDVVVRTKSGNWALFGGERLALQELGFSYRVDAEEPVPAPKDLKLSLTTEVYHVTGTSHAAFSVRAQVICWRLGPQLYRYQACPYTVQPGGVAAEAIRLAAFFRDLEVVMPDGTEIVYSIPEVRTIPGIRMANSGLPSRANRATGLGFTEANRGVIYEAVGWPDLDAFAVAGIPGIRPGTLSVEKGGLDPVLPRIKRATGPLLLYAGGSPVRAGTKVTVEVETGKARVPVLVNVPEFVYGSEVDTFVLAGFAAADIADFQFGQTGLVTHFTLDESLAQPAPAPSGVHDPRWGADHIYSTVQMKAIRFAGVCYVNPDPRRLVEDIEALAEPVTEVEGCEVSSCGPQGLYCYSNQDVQPTVTVTATDPGANESGDPGLFTFTRTGPIDVPLTIFFSVTGSATPGVDYQAIGTFVNLGAGVASVTKQVLAVSDSLTEPTESVTVAIDPNPAYITGQPSVATVYITDNTPVIIVLSTGTAATEAGVTANFTFQRTGGTLANALTVNFTVGGTATSGTDYTALGTSVTFTSGQTIALKTVTPLPDALVEGTESVVLAIASGTGYAKGNPSTATVYITDTTPVVTVAATAPNATESGTTGTFTFTRTGPTTAALTANFTMSGTAVDGIDFGTLSGFVTFGVGQATATKVLVPTQDILVEGSEYATLTLAAGTGYVVGNPKIATVYILDDDAVPPPSPVITVVATDDRATEWGDTGLFTFSRTGSTASLLTVQFTLATGAGLATPGTDYTAILTSVTFDAGQATATKMIIPTADAAPEGTETVSLALAAGSGYTIGTPSTAVVYIEDVKPVITVVATDPTANETPGDTGTFKFSRTGPTNFAITAYFTVGGTATPGTDYAALPTSVNFGVGQSEVSLTVSPVADSTPEGLETVTVTLDAAFGYVNGTPSSATVTIEEPPQDLVYITVLATGSVANEAGNPNPGNFVFKVVDIDGIEIPDHPTNLTVNFTVGGSAINGVDYSTQQAPPVQLSSPVVIPAGVVSTSVNIWALPDLIKEPQDEPVIVTITPGPGYLPYPAKFVAEIYIVDDPAVVTLSATTTVTLEGGSDVDGRVEEVSESVAYNYSLTSFRAGFDYEYYYIDEDTPVDQIPTSDPNTIHGNMLKDVFNRAGGEIKEDNPIVKMVGGSPVAVTPGGRDPAIPSDYDGFTTPFWFYSYGDTTGWRHEQWPGSGGYSDPISPGGWYPTIWLFNKADNPQVVPGRWGGARKAVGTLIVPGDEGQEYVISLSMQGVAQRSVYTGGDPIIAGTNCKPGGLPADAIDDFVKLTFSGYSEVYYLNAGGSRTAGNVLLGYSMDLPIKLKAGTTATLEINNQDGFQYRAAASGSSAVPTENVWIELTLTAVIV